jgi:hypothetical protein
MDQKPDVIREQIEAHRQELAGNVNELENRVRKMTDWRMRFQQKPGMLLGVSFAAGLIASWLTRGHHRQALSDCQCYCAGQ